jgi:hypothetical protein
MNIENAVGTVFVNEFASLPGGVWLEFVSFTPGWSRVNEYNGYELTKKIEEAHWNFFFIAGESSAVAIGRGIESTFVRAIRRLLARRTIRRFDALEITSAVLKRFLGIPYIRVTVNSRHIQKDAHLEAPTSFELMIVAKDKSAELMARQEVSQIPSL